MEFFALDLETTGLDPRKDEILEIAWVRFLEGKPRERFQTLVRVAFLPKEVEGLTGISPERLRRAPPLSEVLPGVLGRLAGKVVVAHNAPFDRAFLQHAAARLGLELPEIHWVDTLAISRAIWPERESHALPALREVLGLEAREAHRALPDAEATGYLFLEELAAFPYLPEPTRAFILRGVPLPARELLAAGRKEGGREKTVLEEVFSLLSRKIPGFQLRKAQLGYAAWVERALREGGVYLLEAGPGTGKTYGYLVPLLLAPEGRAVISTRTKALQDQLWHRDLPALREALRADVRVALLKGFDNYLCPWALEREGGLFSGSLRKRIQECLSEVENPEVGELYKILGFDPETRVLVERIRARPHRCLGRECPFLSRCPPRRARRSAQEAEIVVVNHSLLVADFLAEGGILGEYEVLIADEAHSLPKAFEEGLTRSISPADVAALLEEIEAMLPPQAVPRRELRGVWAELRRLRERLHALLPDEPAPYSRREGLRFLSAAQELIWRLLALKEALEDRLPGLEGEERGLVTGEIAALENLVSEMEYVLAAEGEEVFWSEKDPDIRFYATPLEFGDRLAADFWGRIRAAILTSATLSVGGRVDFLVRELGLGNAIHRVFPAQEKERRGRVFLLEFFPGPNEGGYVSALARLLSELRERFRRKIMVLFTSRKMLRAVRERLPQEGVISQLDWGDAAQAVEAFRAMDAPAILLGLDSLWEGVDFPGEELEVLVVARLPFPNPADPLIKAKEERLRAQGLDPFRALYLPRAVLKLAQGVGRLLRTPEDRGAVIVADPRIVARPYGEVFRAKLTLPTRTVGDLEELLFALEEVFS